MRTISVISSKGGSGKTTLAVNLALSAHRRGGLVLLADIDSQQSAVAVMRRRAAPGPEFLATSGGKLFQLQLGSSRRGLDWLLIDTPCQPEGEIAEAVKISDLCLIVSRPSFVDLAAALRTAQLVRQLHRLALVVINQAPPARHGVEAPLVAKAMRSLALTGFPVVDLPIRGRTAFQASLDEGLAAQEWEPEGPCGSEMEALWREIESGPRAVQPLADPEPIAPGAPAAPECSAA
jgi:chromosome partitioning protein